jgi:hypothetical protein
MFGQGFDSPQLHLVTPIYPETRCTGGFLYSPLFHFVSYNIIKLHPKNVPVAPNVVT